MSPLFGRKKQEGKTVLLLDVENGSVGSALVRLSPQSTPRLFGENRRSLPIPRHLKAEQLTQAAERAVEEALQHSAEVAARVRGHAAHGPLGEVSHAAVFLSAPWGAMDLTGEPVLPHPITQSLQRMLGVRFGERFSVSYYPSSSAAMHVVPMLFPHEGEYLVCVVSGEVTELVLLTGEDGRVHVSGHATFPLGRNALMRTLATHGGLSEAEALSFLRLPKLSNEHPLYEPLGHFGGHLAGEFSGIAKELFAGRPARSVFILGSEPTGEWFARSLSEHPSLSELFPQGGTVRALRGNNIAPLLSAHARKPDLALLTQAVFVDAQFVR